MTASPPPIVPQPDGWRLPAHLPPNVPRRLSAPWGLVGAGFLVSVVVAFGGHYLVAIAWNACEWDRGVSTSFSLWGLFGLMIVAGWLVSYVGCVLAQPRSTLVRFAAGTVLVVGTVLALVTMNVPRSDPAEYGGALDHEEHPECRADGVPTWWPSWLPS